MPTRACGRRSALLLALCSLLAGCARVGALAASVPASAPLLGPAPSVSVGADDVTLLRSGPATFATIASLIGSAHSSVHIEMYEFGRDDLANEVIAAHARGVDVTVIDDPSELNSAATTQRLRMNDVDVVDYPVRKLMIDHVKLLVVDGSIAVVGGINWGVASVANHDYDALIRGPAVHNLDRVFERDLVTCGRFAAVTDPVPDPAILVAATLPATDIRPLALAMLEHAHTSLSLELFVLTDTGIVHALEAAHQRGVSIHVLLDPSQGSSEPSAAALAAAGVPPRLYRSHGELLHAKAIVADSGAILFGSANWSGGGFARNHEVDIELPSSPAIAAQMEAQMTLDWNASA